MIGIDRIAINQATTRKQWSLRETIKGFARHGVQAIGIWRDKLDECGLREAKSLLEGCGMTVTGLNRAGPFLLSKPGGGSALDDAMRAIDEAAELNAQHLMLFSGGLPGSSKDIEAARNRFEEIAAELL